MKLPCVMKLPCTTRADKKPDWLTKPGYLAYGALRSYPLGQLRRLCSALHDRLLPLGQHEVRTLVIQAVWQLGSLEVGARGTPELLWRSEWEGPAGVLAALCQELARLAAELEHSPAEQEAVQVLGPLAAYLSGWHAPVRDVARRFTHMTSSEAEELEGQVAALPGGGASSGAAAVVAQLRAKQGRWRAMALACHCAGKLTIEDAGSMLSLMVSEDLWL